MFPQKNNWKVAEEWKIEFCVNGPYNHTEQQQTHVSTAVTSDLWAQSIISFTKMPNTNQFGQEMTFYFWKHKLTSIPFLHQSPLTTIQERLITKSTMKGFEWGNNGTSVCRARCAIQLLAGKQRRACPTTACDASKHIKRPAAKCVIQCARSHLALCVNLFDIHLFYPRWELVYP